MEQSAYIGSAFAGLAYLVLAVCLLGHGARTQSNPERLIGLTFLIWSLSYALWVSSILLRGQPDLESQLIIASRLASNLGSVSIAFFPLLAFSRGSRWAKWLVAVTVICMIAGTAGSIWIGDPQGIEPLTNAWWWFEWIGEIVPAVWIGVEGFHHYGMARPRVRLGLCEPIAGHRYLLWGLAGTFWTLLDFVVIGQYVDFWATRSWSAVSDNLVGFCEIAALAMIWLAYFAPAAYQRRINASAASP